VVGKGTRASQYGWLRVGDGSRPGFMVSEDRVHRVRLVDFGDGTFQGRCSCIGCGFRTERVEDIEVINRLAAYHHVIATDTKKKKKKKKKQQK